MSRAGKILHKSAALLVCDLQEKFRPSIQHFPQVLNVAARLLKGAELLDMPVLVTEQYPKGLGHTVSELDVSHHKVFTKTCFSMMVPTLQAEIQKLKDVRSVVLCGIEAHACVQQTALDLIEQGYDVHVVVDACSSRTMVDRLVAYQRMRASGAHLSTCESVLLGLVRDAGHPKFKQIQEIIREPSPDSALLSRQWL
ncbi:isochorismatase domain-containing protein 2-like [Physella acuta]|uniref:isochorismatase domain-containing protein 2-like n=1 Tax=Physella acuta TaxID=109671 RepID=UPI0027DC994D|nr:isochorismatase domain-containing protein 2-like [Physella acuta]XP_059150726.1 isochorismatase domain-containing protein 2-like [Physella acuta]